MSAPKQSQRERLIEAMTVVAARYGYREASVARVIKEAGVSRATFYQHFKDKEDCFLAAYRAVAQRVAIELRRVDAEPRTAGRPRELLGRLLAAADREPAAAKIVLLESLAAGTAVRAEHEKLLGALELVLDAYLDGAAVDGMQLEISARSLLGGFTGVVGIRLLRGEAGRLLELREGLEAWIDAYALHGDSRRSRDEWDILGADLALPVEPEPTALDDHPTRERGVPARAVIASEQRQRILAAAARLCRQGGYLGMTVADMVATAGITREAFYEQFRSKEDAFLAAQAYALQTSISITAPAFFSGERWEDRVWSGIMTLLRYFGSVPDFAALDVVESYSVGPAAIRRSFESRMAFTLFLEDGYRLSPEAERLPRLCSEAIAGAILELMRRRAIEGQTELILQQAPQIVYTALAPFLGPEGALRLIESKCADAPAA